MVTAEPLLALCVGVKKGVWLGVPTEVVDSVRLTAVPVFATGLPNWSCTWTAKGPMPALGLTVWLPVTTGVKLSGLATPATMVKPLVVPDATVPLTVTDAVIVGAPARVSE